MQKYIYCTLACVFLILIVFSCSVKQSGQENNIQHEDYDLTNLKGPYLGQEAPGNTPKLFAPGIIADIFKEHSSAAFTPDGKEVFWTRQAQFITPEGNRSRVVVIMHMKQVAGKWTEPELAPFNEGRWNFLTCISPDGNKIYFESIRPQQDTKEAVREIWVVEKMKDGWSEANVFQDLKKWEMPITKVQISRNGNLYFQSTYPKPALPNPSWGVAFFRSKLLNGEYQEPEMLDSTINSANYLDYGFHVDPDERFILFCSDRPGGYSSLDLYISYQNKDEHFGEAINLGRKINSFGKDGSDWPCLSPDGKYLFFMTGMKADSVFSNTDYEYEKLFERQLSVSNADSKIHWVSTSFLDSLRQIR